MLSKDIIAWVLVVVLTPLLACLRLEKLPFIIAAALVAVSSIWAILITMGHAENWSFVLDLGRYAFYCLVSGLILVIIRHIINKAGRSAKSEDKSATE
jgi:hypothetical protein